MLGLSVGLPAARWRSRQRHFSAMPPSMAASLDPVVDVPVASSLVGRVPQPAQHVHAAHLDLSGARVLVLVDHVLVERLGHEPLGLRLHPRGHERGEVQAGVAVEHELVVHELVRGVRVDSPEGIMWRRRPAGLALLASTIGLTRHIRGVVFDLAVQCHGAPPQGVGASWSGSAVGALRQQQDRADEEADPADRTCRGSRARCCGLRPWSARRARRSRRSPNAIDPTMFNPAMHHERFRGRHGPRAVSRSRRPCQPARDEEADRSGDVRAATPGGWPAWR